MVFHPDMHSKVIFQNKKSVFHNESAFRKDPSRNTRFLGRISAFLEEIGVPQGRLQQIGVPRGRFSDFFINTSRTNQTIGGKVVR